MKLHNLFANIKIIPIFAPANIIISTLRFYTLLGSMALNHMRRTVGASARERYSQSLKYSDV